uniref:Secreted protein n=1 Tax=Arundo donax TaxID=35708 RepID=A0A0A9GLU0_ARUDO
MVSLGLLRALCALLTPSSNAPPLAALEILRIFSVHQVITTVSHRSSSTPMMMLSAICSAVALRKSSTCPLFSSSSLLSTALAL